jgi:hypothetical protein
VEDVYNISKKCSPQGVASLPGYKFSVYSIGEYEVPMTEQMLEVEEFKMFLSP